MELTTEQKYKALNAFSPLEFGNRGRLDDWFVTWRGINVASPKLTLYTSAMGNGHNPNEAVDNMWDTVLDYCKKNHLLVKDGFSDHKTYYTWNGFMWEQVTEVLE